MIVQEIIHAAFIPPKLKGEKGNFDINFDVKLKVRELACELVITGEELPEDLRDETAFTHLFFEECVELYQSKIGGALVACELSAVLVEEVWRLKDGSALWFGGAA